jgi:hypothetical protein
VPAARARVHSLALLPAAVCVLCAGSRAQPAPGAGPRVLRQRAFALARAGNTKEAARVFGTVAELEPGVCARAHPELATLAARALRPA